MNIYPIALFGEAEKGQYNAPYFCRSLDELEENFGHPPSDSRGLLFAIQALLYNQALIYFRVENEGFSNDDYLIGLQMLEKQTSIPQISAIGIPGVGDRKIIEAAASLCGMVLISGPDLYDYLTAR